MVAATNRPATTLRIRTASQTGLHSVAIVAGSAEQTEATTRRTRQLHLRTARVPLELVLWHLIAEWDVTSKTEDWAGLLTESLDGFERRRQAR